MKTLTTLAIGAGMLAASAAYAGSGIPQMTNELVATGLSSPLYVTPRAQRL